jgi:hypothetical protein
MNQDIFTVKWFSLRGITQKNPIISSISNYYESLRNTNFLRMACNWNIVFGLYIIRAIINVEDYLWMLRIIRSYKCNFHRDEVTAVYKGLNGVTLIGVVGVWLVALLQLKLITLYFIIIIIKCDSNVNNLQNLLNTKICFLALLFLFLLQAFV